MMNYLIYDPVNGRIVGSRYCSPGEIARNTPVGLSALQADQPSVPSHISGGSVVSGAIDILTLSDHKALKNAEINSYRLAANQATFNFQNKVIACDPLSRSDIDGVNGVVCLTGALPNNFPNAWKAIDNTYVSIPDRATWISFYAAMVNQGVVNFNYAQTLKTELAAAQDLNTVQTIVWVNPGVA
jgi:hypothetical protein